jgi:pyruvate/2-oxoacid:ferredoxin oxidoreductase alpha subunit
MRAETATLDGNEAAAEVAYQASEVIAICRPGTHAQP